MRNSFRKYNGKIGNSRINSKFHLGLPLTNRHFVFNSFWAFRSFGVTHEEKHFISIVIHSSISIFRIPSFSQLSKSSRLHLGIYIILLTQNLGLNGQSVHLSENFIQPYWPEYLDQDTQLFKRSMQFASSNSVTLEKHDYQLKFPIHPHQLLSKIQQLQSQELIQKFSSLHETLKNTESSTGYFHIRFSSEINLSSVNKLAIILRDSQNREIKLNWGNTKDQLEVLFLGNLIYSGKPFQYNSSNFTQNVYVEIRSDSLKILTFSEPDNSQNLSEFSLNLHTIQLPISPNFNTPHWAILAISQSGKTAINSHKIHQINWGWGECFTDTIATSINQISNNEFQFNIYSKNYFFISQNLNYTPTKNNPFTYRFPEKSIHFLTFNSGVTLNSGSYFQFHKHSSFTVSFKRDTNPNFIINTKDSLKYVLDSIRVTLELPINFKNVIFHTDSSQHSIALNHIECRNSLTRLDTVEPENIYISEVLADPEPHYGRIPAVTYIEIVNRSNKDLNLETIYWSKSPEFSTATKIGKRIALKYTQSDTLSGHPSSWRYKFRLPGKTQALVINSKDSNVWSQWILDSSLNHNFNVIVISCPDFPRFNYSEGSVYIFNQSGHSISKISYNKEMQLPEFQEGGISLEIINSNQPHSWEFNAKSNRNFGGSPGIPNSIDTSMFPIQSQVIQYKITDAFCSGDSIYLIWNHNLPSNWPTLTLLEYRNQSDIPVDSFLLFRRNNTLSAYCGGIHRSSPCLTHNSYSLDTSVLFPFIRSNQKSTIYNELLKNLDINLHTGDSKNLRFNEILSNNFTGFSDFIELVNTDTLRCIDLENWDLLYYDENRILKNIIPLKNEYFRFISPKKCKVFTDDRYSVYRQFPQFYPFNIAQSIRFPDVPNTTGTWALNHHLYGIQDEVNMNLLNQEFPDVAKGFSLEKIHPSFESNFVENWFPYFSDQPSITNKNPYSSIPNSGATPGELNSHHQNNESINTNWLTITNRIVRFNHFQLLILPIEISLPEEGYSLSAGVFNSSGRQICTLDLPKQLPQKASLFVNLPREIQSNGNYVIKFEAVLPYHPTKRITKRFTVMN